MASLSLALQAMVLGIVQGLTEFLPSSSSAHLVIVPWLFGWADPVLSGLTFDVALHFGTLLAVVGFFAADWGRLISAWVRNVVRLQFGEDQNSRMAWYILLATIPGAVAGFFFESKVSTSFHVLPIPRLSMVLMAIVIAVVGGLLFVSDRFGTQARPFSKIGWIIRRDDLG